MGPKGKDGMKGVKGEIGETVSLLFELKIKAQKLQYFISTYSVVKSMQ